MAARRAWTACCAAMLTLGLALAAHAQAAPDQPVARVLGTDLGCIELASKDANGCARALLRHVRARVAQAYIDRHGLAATAAEVAALEGYNAAFERHDRAQRARKLAELEARLAQAEGNGAEAERLRAFRDVLLRLAHFEADVDAGLETRDAVPQETLRAWIESAKLDVALYARYGGSVGVAASGPYAHGARIALIEDALARGEVVLYDQEVARRFRAELNARPQIMHSGGEPDFTPFWRRPIPVIPSAELTE